MSKYLIGFSIALFMGCNLLPSPVWAEGCWVSWGIDSKSSGVLDQLGPLENQLGRKTDVVVLRQDWKGGFDVSSLDGARSWGATPLMEWTPDSVPLDEIANGNRDTYIDSWATGLAAWKHTVLIAPLAGMGSGEGHSYSLGLGGTPDLLKKAWSHIHSRFVSAGAQNVRFVFQPQGKASDISLLYPGGDTVDDIQVFAYNNASAWQYLDALLAPQIDVIHSIAVGKTIIAEISSEESPSQTQAKAAWLHNAASTLAQNASIKIVLYDMKSNGTWGINSSSASLLGAREAFGVNTPYCAQIEPLPLPFPSSSPSSPAPSPTVTVSPQPSSQASISPSPQPSVIPSPKPTTKPFASRFHPPRFIPPDLGHSAWTAWNRPHLHQSPAPLPDDSQGLTLAFLVISTLAAAAAVAIWISK